MSILRFSFKIKTLIKMKHYTLLSQKNCIMVSTNSNKNLASKISRIKSFLYNLNLTKKLGKFDQTMQTLVEKFGPLWIETLNKKVDNKDKFVLVNKIRIADDRASKLEELLWDEFINSKENIFHLHLSLIEYFNSNGIVHQETCVIFLNRTFENWWKRFSKLGNSKNGHHLTPKCTEASCLCVIDENTIVRAFDLVIKKNICLLASFNRIYKFEHNFELLKPKIDQFIQSSKGVHILKLVNDLKLNDRYEVDYEKVK